MVATLLLLLLVVGSYSATYAVSSSTLDNRPDDLPLLCPICRTNDRPIINPHHTFTMSNGITWSCHYLQETVQDVAMDGWESERLMCRHAQLLGEMHGCICGGVELPLLSEQYNDINPACNMCATIASSSSMLLGFVPSSNYKKTVDTQSFGTHNCKGLYEALADGILSSEYCESIQTIAGPVCCLEDVVVEVEIDDEEDLALLPPVTDKSAEILATESQNDNNNSISSNDEVDSTTTAAAAAAAVTIQAPTMVPSKAIEIDDNKGDNSHNDENESENEVDNDNDNDTVLITATKECKDDVTFRFNNDETKDCSTWVHKRPNIRCTKIDPIKNRKVSSLCPSVCNIKACNNSNSNNKSNSKKNSNSTIVPQQQTDESGSSIIIIDISNDDDIIILLPPLDVKSSTPIEVIYSKSIPSSASPSAPLFSSLFMLLIFSVPSLLSSL